MFFSGADDGVAKFAMPAGRLLVKIPKSTGLVRNCRCPIPDRRYTCSAHFRSLPISKPFGPREEDRQNGFELLLVAPPPAACGSAERLGDLVVAGIQ